MSHRLGMSPWDIARAPDHEAGGFIDANPSVGTTDPIRLFIDESGAEKDAQRMLNTIGQKELIRDYNPALYTGGMRKLMQVSHLRGAAWFSHAHHDLFLAGWGDTYGVFIGAAQDGVCPRYIIRICSSGIYRIPINFSQPLPSNWQSIESAAHSQSAYDAAQSVGRLWSAGNFDPSQAVQIGDAPAMYSGYAAFYAACGWAFDSDGHHAVTTAWRADPTDGTGARKLASLWKITITESGGVPVSATCSKTEEDKLVNPSRDDSAATENNAILQVATNSYGLCATFSCWPGFSNMGCTSTNTPVFAYYDANDTMQVVRYTYKGDIASYSTTSGTDLPGLYYRACDREGNAEDEPGIFPHLVDAGVYRVSDLNGKTTRSGSTSETAVFSSIGLEDAPQNEGGTRSDSSYVLDGPSGYIYSNQWDVSPWGVKWEWYICGNRIASANNNYAFGNNQGRSRVLATQYRHYIYSYNELVRTQDTIILHGTDRTSFVHYRFSGTYLAGTSGTRSNAPIASASEGLEHESSFGIGDWKSISVGSSTFTQSDYWQCDGTYKPTQHSHIGSLYANPIGELIKKKDYSLTSSSSVDAVSSTVISETASLVIGATAIPLTVTNGSYYNEIYTNDSGFNYESAGSGFNDSRYSYAASINAASVASGFNYSTCVNSLHAFIGVF